MELSISEVVSTKFHKWPKQCFASAVLYSIDQQWIRHSVEMKQEDQLISVICSRQGEQIRQFGAASNLSEMLVG
jgi:hypothetical protein